jgi:hypothetical protein
MDQLNIVTVANYGEFHTRHGELQIAWNKDAAGMSVSSVSNSGYSIGGAAQDLLGNDYLSDFLQEWNFIQPEILNYRKSIFWKCTHAGRRLIANTRKFGIFYAVIALAIYSDSASATELTACLSKSGGIYSESDCRLLEINDLTKKQREISQEVKSELLQCTPRLIGYDYKRALTNYSMAQKHWEQFLKRTCYLVRDTFGQGTAVAAAELSCEIELCQENLKRSEQLLSHLRDTRSYLLRQNASGESQGIAIVCK